MNQAVDLNGLTKATRRRQFDDGLVDLAIGAGILVLGLLEWFLFSPGGLRWWTLTVVNDRDLALVGVLGLAALIIGGAYGVRRLIERIRISTIWIDSGFVKPLSRQASWPTILFSVAVILGMTIGAAWLMATGRIGTESALRTLVASTGIATGIIFFGIGVSLDLRRYLAVGLVGGALSALILFMSVSFSIAWLILGIVWIVVLGVSGVWALRKALSVSSDSSSE
jgi:hypothetical protein